MPTNPTIFLVEDNQAEVTLLEEAFLQRGYAVDLHAVPDGEQALRYLTIKATRRDIPPPDLILLDQHVPRIKGSELLAFILDDPWLSGIPAMIFTGSADEDLRIDCERLIKPTTWTGYLEIADRLYALMTNGRR